jgi:hypothetical protein
MATIIPKITGLERALVQNVAQPVRGLAPEVLKLLAPQVILPRCGGLPLREGSRQRVETIVGFSCFVSDRGAAALSSASKAFSSAASLSGNQCSAALAIASCAGT